MRRSFLFRRTRGVEALNQGVRRGSASVAFSLIVSFAVLGCPEHSEESREQQCERLRDHVVEMRVAAIPRTVQPPEEDARFGRASPPKNATPQQPDIEGHRKALKQALGHEYIESCVAALTSAQLECSLGASDTAGLSACRATAH